MKQWRKMNQILFMFSKKKHEKMAKGNKEN